MSGNVLIGILIVANTPLYFVLGKIFFGGWDGLFETLRLIFTPEILNALQGEYPAARWAGLKTLVFVALCGSCIYGEYVLLARRLVPHPATPARVTAPVQVGDGSPR